MTIDVLMPVLATQLDWVQAAVDSIINQVHKDFRFIIVDDNNDPGELTDYLYDLSKKDCCISVVRTKEKKGIAAALNHGLQYCNNELIVRMDADDIASPLLLQLHNDFFTKFPDRHICGVQIKLFNDRKFWYSNHPLEVTRKLAAALPPWFVNHPGIAYRAAAIKSVGYYCNTPSALAEDYALWVKFLIAGYTIYNVPYCLMDYRVHQKSFTQAPDRQSPDWHQFLNEQKNLLNEQ